MRDSIYTSDPQKGQWGGHPRRNDRELLAEIKPEPGEGDWYRIRLTVRSTNPAKPLTGAVRFHLHPTFDTPADVEVDASGVSQLELLAWGSFTVGAEADNGQTKLELDLAEVQDAPKQFRLM